MEDLNFISLEQSNKPSKLVSQAPLYKDINQLLLLSYSTFSQSTKLLLETFCKYALMGECKMLKCFLKAYRYKDDRISYIKLFIDTLEEVKIYIRLIIDNSKLAQNNVDRFNILLDQLGKQSNGYLSSLLKPSHKL